MSPSLYTTGILEPNKFSSFLISQIYTKFYVITDPFPDNNVFYNLFPTVTRFIATFRQSWSCKPTCFPWPFCSHSPSMQVSVLLIFRTVTQDLTVRPPCFTSLFAFLFYTEGLFISRRNDSLFQVQTFSLLSLAFEATATITYLLKKQVCEWCPSISTNYQINCTYHQHIILNNIFKL